MKNVNIKHTRALLCDIANGLKKISSRPVHLGAVEVKFWVGDDAYEFGLDDALEAIAKDLYFDERGNWSEATRATVGLL